MDAVTHCHIEFDWEPGICTSVTRPFCSFTETEQTIIDDEVEKFILKGIIRLSSHEDGQVTLSHDSLEELHLWSANILTASRRTFHNSPDVVVYTDASQMGWGAQIEHGNNTSGIWSKSESSRHINYLELLAVKLALSSLLDARNNIHVRVMSDNNTAVSYINSMGGCRSLECNSIAKDIWDWAIDKDIWLSAAHIPGSSNIDADQLSRNLNLDLEWMLSAPIFQRIVALFGKPDIDLFASRLNAQVEDYVSWKPHPMAKFVDAFTIDWSQFFFYAYPPFCLVSRCVQKIIQDHASGILAIPLWTTQPYFTAVLSLLTETPRVFNASVQNLVHQTLDGPHPLHQRLQLMVCKLSGDPCKSLRFRQTLSTSSCIHAETALRNNLKCILQYKVYKWLQFCSERKNDPLHPIVTAVLSFLHSSFQEWLELFIFCVEYSSVCSL